MGKTAGKRKAKRPAALNVHAGKPVEKTAGAAGKHIKFTDVRELVDSIFEKNDPVEIATSLLSGKANATVAKIWGLLLEYRFGKPAVHIDASGPEGSHFNFITLAPRPERDLADLSEDSLEAEGEEA